MSFRFKAKENLQRLVGMFPLIFSLQARELRLLVCFRPVGEGRGGGSKGSNEPPLGVKNRDCKHKLLIFSF